MKHQKIVVLLANILLITTSLNAQNITQILRGRIMESFTQKPISDAAVIVDNDLAGTYSDINGLFIFKDIPVGRHRLVVRSVGFQTIVLTDVLVESGKESVLDIVLKPIDMALDTFVITAQSQNNERVSYPSVSVIEKLRFQYPATYADPARYASYSAGVAVDNDQANNLSIRGASPNAMQWYMEGAEIVNPNHLSNAGTLTDRASANGGGVMILSAQLLDNTTLYQGAMPVAYGNALAGALDMRLRKGNDEKRQSTISLSLIGLDAATEGYFSKKSKASYLVNYRYSTVGLLSQLGVPLGDEAINYQDASFNIHLPTRKMGEFSIFGVGGVSENIFKAKASTEWKVDKDSQDISFHGRMGAFGIKHQINLGKNTLWKSVFVASALNNERQAIGYNRLAQPIIVDKINNTHSKFFFRTDLEHKLGSRTEGGIGVVVKREDLLNENIYKTSSLSTIYGADGGSLSVIPYADISGKMTQKLSYRVGLRATYFDFNKELSFEPSAILNYALKSHTYFQLNYSRQSQLLQPQFYFAQNEKGAYINKNLDLVKSDNISIGINSRFKNDIRSHFEIFAQQYSNVYYTQDASLMVISILDDLNSLNAISSAKGTAQTYGAAWSLNQSTAKGLFWQLNFAGFNARFMNDKGVDRSLTYNNIYTTNALLGKEWAMGANKNKLVGVSGRAVTRGGFWSLQDKNWTQGNSYFRADLNVYFKRNHKNWHSTVQLDIQNVTNRENAWTVVYDNLQKRFLPKKQLGMIPNLTYKVEF